MELVADVLLAGGAFGAALYCYILAERMKRFAALESGMGGAIAVLSQQVDEMTRALERARSEAGGSEQRLAGLTDRAEAAARRLDLLIASLHDLPEEAEAEPEPVVDRPRLVRRRVVRTGLEAAE